MNQRIHFPILTLLLSILAIPGYGQDKLNQLYNTPIELTGTAYVLSRFESWGKMSSARDRYLLFINTRNGQSKRVDFPENGRVQYIQQIRIDSLHINKILMTAHTADPDNGKHNDWWYPNQMFLLSVDGEEKIPLTDDRFFVKSWEINNTTGNIVITGYYDVNGNGKHDKEDEYQMRLYDLKAAKFITKIIL